MKKKNGSSSEIAITIFAAFLILVVIVKCAWVCDDAYISFRYIKNLINGHGLVWNIGERVQAFTNPLYIFGLTPFFILTKNMYLSSLFYSILLTMLALYFGLFQKRKRNAYILLLCAALLVSSKSFIDFSTSGLENPMTFFLIALFYSLFFSSEKPSYIKQFFILCIISSLAIVNRMDSILLFIPALCYSFIKDFRFKKILYAIIGFSPFIIWELFSIIYYGSFVPNTAIAKLNILTDKASMIKSGLYYLKATFIFGDYFTLPVIIVTFIASFIYIKKNFRYSLAAASGIIYIFYIVYIGGDFMVGRHLSSVYFLSIIIIFNIGVELYNKEKHKLETKIAFAAIILIGLISYTSPIRSSIAYDQNVDNIFTKDSIGIVTDERQFYYYDAGFGYYIVNTIETGYDADRPLFSWGKSAPKEEGVYLKKTIGFSGYFSHDYAYIIDLFALSDPLLSRIPAAPNQRTGHYERLVPQGYQQSISSGENLIQNEYLNEYYDKISTVAYGNIFDAGRIQTIFKLNTGQYDHLIENYMNSDEYIQYLTLWEESTP